MRRFRSASHCPINEHTYKFIQPLAIEHFEEYINQIKPNQKKIILATRSKRNEKKWHTMVLYVSCSKESQSIRSGLWCVQ